MKYPRTYHLPWSPGTTSADKIIESIDHLLDKVIVITEKLDGECTSMYCDKIHASSEDSGHHESRSWIKNFWGEICHRIPEGIQIVGENMYAKHSIFYEHLDTYFYGFMAFKNNKVLSWVDTLRLFREVGIEPVPTLVVGELHKDFIRKRLVVPRFEPSFGNMAEGYVIRLAEEFPVSEFDRNVLKYVRKDHVQTDTHWSKDWTKNELRIN
jgi:hypothetical protein